MASDHSVENRETTCCIAGGGPAGMMLGVLLARAGVDVLVLEKHADFLRDFRGDTIHPSTLEIMAELGWDDELLQRPHQRLSHLRANIFGNEVLMADFSKLPVRHPFIALMPQWDFLDFLAERGRAYPTFHLEMRAEATGLLREGDAVTGVRFNTPDGPREARADLVIGADGRSSTIRERAGLPVEDFGAPMDVLWWRLSRTPDDPTGGLGRVGRGHFMAMIERGDYWQCGFVIPKGGRDVLEERGLEALREDVRRLAPFVGDRVSELRDWDEIKLLTVQVNRLTRWSLPGLLCIGDAAHAMSPIGGVGINLAIQDAVAAANILAGPLRTGTVSTDNLEAVQQRRERPTRWTQRMQLTIQNRVISRVLADFDITDQEQVAPLPWPLRLWRRLPFLARIPARLIGLGFRPEHVRPVRDET